MKIAVFGGMNMDICGRTDHPLRLRDSNIGHIQMQPGGVGRNIAARLAENGAKCELFTVLGSDVMSDTLRADCQKRGISLQHALCCEGGACVYLCMHDMDGDMLLAMNDMALTERLDCGYARSILPILAGFDLCVLDANAPADTLTFLAQELKIPTLLDPVSCAKAERVRAAETESGETLTVFERTTAAALLHFAAQRCDIVVLEVGLGGRFDLRRVCSGCLFLLERRACCTRTRREAVSYRFSNPPTRPKPARGMPCAQESPWPWQAVKTHHSAPRKACAVRGVFCSI